MIDPASPVARLLLGVVLAALVVLLTVRAVRKDRREYQRFKRFHSTARRQRMYRKWLIDSFTWFGGASLVVLILVWQFIPVLLAEVDANPAVGAARRWFADSGVLGPLIVAVLVIGFVALTVAAVILARNEDEIPAVGDIQALLPRNRAELRYGAALSVNAGLVEELLFRLAIPTLVFAVAGNAAVAIAVSIVLFGALHAYQGAPGIIGSMILGSLLMVTFLATGSIVTAIVVHALIDLRSLVLIPVVVKRVHLVPPKAGSIAS